MFGNKCLGELKYEGTTAAIFMAGLSLSFIIDYLGARFVQWRQKKTVRSNAEVAISGADTKPDNGSTPSLIQTHAPDIHGHGPMREATPMEEKINVINLEAGIIFHSIRKPHHKPACLLLI